MSEDHASEKDPTREISRLTQLLDQTNNEKVQAAQYGISLLEENEKLKGRLAEVEELYELARGELEVTKDALDKSFHSSRKTEESGVENEEKLICESLEVKLTLGEKIADLELKLKNAEREVCKFKQLTLI